MLANFLNKSKPINFIGLLIFFSLSYFYTVFTFFFNDGFSFDKLLKSIFLLLLLLCVFFFFNFIVSRNKLTFDNSYAYFLFTTLVICILPEIVTYKVLAFTILYLLFLRKIYSLRSAVKVLEKLFDSGFWLGILFIMEPLSILFLVVIYTGVYLHKKITIHTLFTPIIGFILPIFVYFTYFFWIDKTEEFISLFSFDFNYELEVYSQQKFIWLLLFLCLSVLFAVFFKSIKALSVSNTFRRSWILLLVNLFITILFLCSLPVKNGSEIIYVLLHVSVIIANGIELINKKIVLNIVLYTFLIGCIFLRFFL